MRKLGKNALANLALDTSCQIDLGSSVTTIDSSNYKTNIVWGFNHDNPIQDDNTFRQQNSVVLDAIEADESTTTSTFSFDYNSVKNSKLILQKRINGNNMSAVMATDTKNSTTSNSMTTKTQRADVTEIYIPFGIRSLYNFVFDSTSIEEIHIPESITSIGKGAFTRTKLKEIVLPSSIATVAEQAFGSCGNLEKADFSKTKVTSLKNTFQSSIKLKEVFLPNTLEVIGLNSFYHCSSLTSITIPDSVTSIGNYAFQGCLALEELTIPEGVTTIGQATFCGCSNLANITIPNTVETIGYRAFQNCTAFTEITIPNSVTSIGAEIFLCCSNLKKIYIDNVEGSLDTSNFGAANVEISWLR